MCTVILQFLLWLACGSGYFCKHHIWLSKVMFLKHLILMETQKLIVIITKSYKLLFCKQSQTHCTVQTTHDKNHINIHVNRAINIAVYHYRLVNNNCVYIYIYMRLHNTHIHAPVSSHSPTQMQQLVNDQYSQQQQTECR